MAPGHGVVCVIIAVLLVLQGALYARRSSWIIARSLEASLPPPLPPPPPSPAVSPISALSAAAFLQQAAAKQTTSSATVNASSTSSKDCGESTGNFPRNRILIIHEQHLQSMGCDVRLLRFVKDLVYLNQEVSMLFRGSTPSKMRQPKSKQLASILHIESFEEDQLRKGLREPPGLYEWTSTERFSQLMAKGYFNMVIIFLWFWYDPQPSVAELVLPVLRAHSPEDRQPFVALLSDDAHAIRSSRLGEVEIHPKTREGYNERARNYWLRQKNMYQLVDMVMYISAMDQVAEEESYPFVPYYRLLRMPIRAFRILSKNMPAPMQERTFLTTGNIGFIGNGLTPTNHLGIQWFLEHCWEDVRRQLPGVRMRLIGRPPGERMLKGQQVPCVKTEDAHCGWAWGTTYAGKEKAMGIDELGYLSAEGLLEEVLSWRLMIVPVLRTTGVNTKILVALELGVPLVITPVAASPFDIPDNETVVAFANQAADFTQQVVNVYTTSWLWTHMSRSSRQHWENLAAHDPARNDVRNVLLTVCRATTSRDYLPRWTPPRIAGEPDEHVVDLRPPSDAVPARAKSACFGASPTNASGPPHPLLLVAAFSQQTVFPKFNQYISSIWGGICQECGLVCAPRREGAPYTLGSSGGHGGQPVDVLLDMHWALPLRRLDDLPHRLVFYSWDPGKLGRYFHFAGNMLQMAGPAERVVAQTVQRPETSVYVQINKEMRSSGGFVFSWRRALAHLGMPKPAIQKLVDAHISRFAANWTTDLAAHMAAYKSG